MIFAHNAPEVAVRRVTLSDRFTDRALPVGLCACRSRREASLWLLLTSFKGAPHPEVLEIDPKVVEFFPFEGFLVYRGEFSPTFPVGLVEPSHFGQPPSLTACRSMVPSWTRR